MTESTKCYEVYCTVTILIIGDHYWKFHYHENRREPMPMDSEEEEEEESITQKSRKGIQDHVIHRKEYNKAI